jgi:hypothetical protein
MIIILNADRVIYILDPLSGVLVDVLNVLEDRLKHSLELRHSLLVLFGEE